MRKIRCIAGSLLVINGVLHLVEFINRSNSADSIGILIFGIIYIITGTLLFNRKFYPVYLGLVIPLIGMTLSILKYGLTEIYSLLTLFKLLGIIVVVACGYLIYNQKNFSTSHETIINHHAS